MGDSVERSEFTEADLSAFRRRLAENLRALEALLARPGFGVGPASIGAELEACIVGADGLVRPVSHAVLARCADAPVKPELVGFNIEYNLPPVPAAGRPFTALERELDDAMDLLDEACVAEGASAHPHRHRTHAETRRPFARTSSRTGPAITRSRAGMARVQRFPVHLDIHGAHDDLQLDSDSVAIEGSSTSLQIHLRVDPERFADTYNAAQLAMPVALALGANSPIFLQRLLWDETRVPLFKQTFVGRPPPAGEWRPAVRVPYGHGWVRRGIHDLLAEAVALYPPVLAVSEDEDSLRAVREGRVPQLAELRLHQGTIWQWNRAVYDPEAGGHVRVEFRALPSGPTPVDMVATAAFLFGLVASLREDVDALLPAFPFRYAEHNFYRAAQLGLDARLLWPARRPPSPVERPILELIDELMPRAEEGLERLGVDAVDRAHYLSVVRDRRDAMTTGARWLRRSLLRLDARRSRPEALQRLTQAYLANVETRRPVHEWKEIEP
jgi:hypothetical protein